MKQGEKKIYWPRVRVSGNSDSKNKLKAKKNCYKKRRKKIN